MRKIVGTELENIVGGLLTQHISYRKIAEVLKEQYKVKISNNTIRNFDLIYFKGSEKSKELMILKDQRLEQNKVQTVEEMVKDGKKELERAKQRLTTYENINDDIDSLNKDLGELETKGLDLAPKTFIKEKMMMNKIRLIELRRRYFLDLVASKDVIYIIDNLFRILLYVGLENKNKSDEEYKEALANAATDYTKQIQ